MNSSNIENAIQDIRFALRTMIKYPAFTLVVVATLAIGIGVNTAIFSLINGIMLEPLPYPQPDRLVRLGNGGLAKGNYLALQERLQTTEVAIIALDTGFNLRSGSDSYSARVNGNKVSANFFSVLGIAPRIGRLFHPGEDKPGQDHVVILSSKLWQTVFRGDPKVVDRSLALDDVEYQVIGVMPPGFSFPGSAGEFWIPAEINPDNVPDMWTFGYNVIGRLRGTFTTKTARAEFKSVFPQILREVPFALPAGFGTDFDVVPLADSSVSSIRTTLLALLGAVVLILLVACVNVANLLLARSSLRQKEMAIRAALGANRRRIVVQLLTESVILGLVGGTLGCILAFFGVMGLKAFLPAQTPRLESLGIDGHVLAFSAFISIVTGLIFGLAPALRASRPDIEQTLRSNTQGSGASGRRTKLSATLVVVEIAMALVLVSGAGLLIKSVWVLSNLSTGFRQDHLLLADITPSNDYCAARGTCGPFYRELVDRVDTLPGVKSTAFTNAVPLDKFGGIPLSVADRPESETSPYLAWYFQISPKYLSTMGISLLQGREFTEDDNQKSPFVVLVSKSFAKFVWPGENPIGKQVKPVKSPNWGTVVGLVDDVRHYKVAPTFAADKLKGDVYFSATQLPPSAMTLVVRSEGDVSYLGRQLPAAVASISAVVPVSHERTIEQVVSNSVAAPRSTMWLFAAFAVLALTLGVVGIYSVISYAVTQRTREIGIRMAMGANRWDILKMILNQGAVLTAAGIVLGLAGGLALARLMASVLYGVKPTDPIIFAVVSLVVATAAVMATYVPSQRATRVKPTVALKHE